MKNNNVNGTYGITKGVAIEGEEVIGNHTVIRMKYTRRL